MIKVRRVYDPEEAGEKYKERYNNAVTLRDFLAE